MPKIEILTTLSFLQLLKLEKQKCPQNFNLSTKNAISGHFKIFFEQLNKFILPCSAENADSEEALPIILEKKVWYFWKADNQENGISFLAKLNLNMSILCPPPNVQLVLLGVCALSKEFGVCTQNLEFGVRVFLAASYSTRGSLEIGV